MFEFKILSKQKGTKARTGSFRTPHGELLTPELAFVATEGEVKAVPKEILPKLPLNLIIVNTFHIWTKGIVGTGRDLSLPENTNFIHKYTNFPRTIMSDSGGFQVFSLGFGQTHKVGKVADIFPGDKKLKSDADNPLIINDEGVTFDNVMLTPEKSMDIQRKIGADIIFSFDECTSPLNTKKYTQNALQRTHRWLDQCIAVHEKYSSKQALFAIVQGGEYKDLRIRSAKFIGKKNVPGFGIGGSLGRNKTDMLNILEWVIPYLPEEKPKHLLGIGEIRDIFEAVERGVDLFDCVIPTREARHKVLYTKKGKVILRKMKNYDGEIDHNCKCLACQQGITYKKLAELYKNNPPAGRPQGFLLATAHNIQFYSDLMKNIRESITSSKFFELKEEVLKYYF